MKKIIVLLLSMPKTIFFNFRAFNFTKAIKLPIIINYKTKIGEVHKNVIELSNYGKKKYRVLFGFGGSKHIISNNYSFISFGKTAQIVFSGKTSFGEGNALRCDYGKLKIGKNFNTNKNCCINCEFEMSFGDDILVGWNVNFRDTDGHQVYIDGNRKISQKKLDIGNHIWICSYADLLKGTKIPDECIIAWKSCVTKQFEETNCIIGGSPAKVIQKNIKWEP